MKNLSTQHKQDIPEILIDTDVVLFDSAGNVWVNVAYILNTLHIPHSYADGEFSTTSELMLAANSLHMIDYVKEVDEHVRHTLFDSGAVKRAA